MERKRQHIINNVWHLDGKLHHKGKRKSYGYRYMWMCKIPQYAMILGVQRK